MLSGSINKSVEAHDFEWLPQFSLPQSVKDMEPYPRGWFRTSVHMLSLRGSRPLLLPRTRTSCIAQIPERGSRHLTPVARDRCGSKAEMLI